MGGTALALYLGHRRSEDLDLFVHAPFEPSDLLGQLRRIGRVEDEFVAAGTLNCVLEGVKVQFLSAAGQHQVAQGMKVGKMPVGSFPDVAAAKLKVIGDRGELRDYYDLMCIEKSGEASVVDMVGWYRRRYRLGKTDQSIYHIVRALGSFHDVTDDPWLSETLGDRGVFGKVAGYWRHRQSEIAGQLFSRS